MVVAGTSTAATQDVHDVRASDAPRVRCGEHSLTHADVRANAARIASGLASHGVVNGDRVAIVMRNDIVFPQITIAVGLLGAVAVPINWHWRGAELEYVLNDSGAKVAVVHAEFAELVARILPEGTHLLVVADGTAGRLRGFSEVHLRSPNTSSDVSQPYPRHATPHGDKGFSWFSCPRRRPSHRERGTMTGSTGRPSTATPRRAREGSFRSMAKGEIGSRGWHLGPDRRLPAAAVRRHAHNARVVCHVGSHGARHRGPHPGHRGL